MPVRLPIRPPVSTPIFPARLWTFLSATHLLYHPPIIESVGIVIELLSYLFHLYSPTLYPYPSIYSLTSVAIPDVSVPQTLCILPQNLILYPKLHTPSNVKPS